MFNLLTPANLHDYQRECVVHQLQHDDSMLWLQMGLGKEQPCSEPVLTPWGWRAIGAIRVGDYVIGSNGAPTRVHGVYPQGNKEVVTVRFSDGAFARCGWDHLWYFQSEHERFKGLPGKVKTIREIFDMGLTKKNGKNGTMFKWSIPLVQPVSYDLQKKLPIDAYTLGVLLGDGCIIESGFSICTDLSTLKLIKATQIRPHETSTYTGYGYLPGVKHILRDLDLMGKRSWEKHIPEMYLRATIHDRLRLLQGLLDTDGSPIDKGGVEFSSTSEALIDGVIELTQSLGGIARNKVSRFTNYQGGVGRESWRVNVKLPSDLTPFRLRRKLDNWVRPTKYQPMRKIVAIESEGRKEASVCISVDAHDSLYVTRNYILTHNTPITLTTIVERMKAEQVQKVLIFGPLRVIQAVWAREARKWSHTNHLRFSVIHGNKEKRARALFANADIFLINYENMNWLAETLDHYYLSQGKTIPFQMVVYDEVSKLKNSTALRMAGGKRDRKDGRGEPVQIRVTGWRKMIDHFKYRTGLTGTPASNGYLDLHGQYLAVDGGKRLGTHITHYKDSYFVSDFKGWSFTPSEIGKQCIESNIADITKKMDARDHLKGLPDVNVVNMMVDLPIAARKAYAEMEKTLFAKLDNGSELEVFSKASVSNKLLQFCNGSPYLNSGSQEFEQLHDVKLEALEDIIEEAAGQPVLCSYSFTADAERIMKKFKSLKPVNLTTVPSKQTESIINKWNNGQIKLMIGHPACLHPKTKVLTEFRGWVNLIDVTDNERVFDGVEFVNHSGCSYSGYKEVIDVFGVTMTPNHKLLINSSWVEAEHVRNCGSVKREALYQYEGDDQYLSEMLTLRGCIENTSPKCDETQPYEKDTLHPLHQRHVSQFNRDSNLENLARDESSCQRSNRFKLRRARDNVVRIVGNFSKFLQRHARNICGQPHHRKSGRQQELFKRKLHMGFDIQTTKQQAEQPCSDLSRRTNALGRTLSQEWFQQNNVIDAIESGNECRPSSDRRNEFELRKKFTHVYDLVNCGPRSRFLIKNDNDDVFISHNSMGHGVDGLQDSGSIVVWFGLNWSLELYDQMNGRIDRQGQKRPVSIIRILCNDTVDLAVADAIERKTDDQEGLKRALQRYRSGITTNDLKVNFF